MIRCSECKYKLENVCLNEKNYPISPDDSILAIKTEDNFGCIHAERADGMTVCCRDCRNLSHNACLLGYHCTGNILLFKMSCPEWQAREGK